MRACAVFVALLLAVAPALAQHPPEQAPPAAPGQAVEPHVTLDLEWGANGAAGIFGHDMEALKLEPGVILVRDTDGVYDDPEDPALRRMITITPVGSPTNDAELRRSSNRVRLYNAPTKGTDLFGPHDTVVIHQGVYYLGGGATASLKVKGDWLRAEAAGVGTKTQIPAKVVVTVIWADISARGKGEASPKPVYDKLANLDSQQGHHKLGVYRSEPKSDDGTVSIRGSVEVQGALSPPDLGQHSFIVKLTTGLQRKGCPATPEGKSTADFGFAFRRYIDSVTFSDGRPPASGIISHKVDDSCPNFVDADPDKSNNKMVIADSDGPGFVPDLKDGSKMTGFYSQRVHGEEYVVFHALGRQSERCSLKQVFGVTIDSAFDYAGDRVSAIFPPNMGAGGNFVTTQQPLPAMTINLLAPKITSAQTDGGDKVIHRNVLTTVTIRGQYLYGSIHLFSPTKNLGPVRELLKETDPNAHFSDATEARAYFNTDLPVGSGYVLSITNSGGESNRVGGFSIAP